MPPILIRSLLALLLALPAAATEPEVTFLDLVELLPTARHVTETTHLPLGTDEVAFALRHGWGPAEQWGQDGVKARWVEGLEAGLDVTALVPRARQIRFLVSHFEAPGAPPQRVDVLVGGRVVGHAPVPDGWTWQEVEAPEEAWVVGTNRITFRLAWSKSPKDLGGDDPRQLSAAISEVRIVPRIHGNLRAAAEAPPPPQAVSIDGAAAIQLRGLGALTYLFRVPPGGRLAFGVRKAPDAERGDGFALSVTAEVDGAPKRVLLVRAFAGLTPGSPTEHAIDLSDLAGRAVRLSFALDPGDAGRGRGDAAAIVAPRLVVPGTSLSEELRHLRETYGPLYVPTTAPRSQPTDERPSAIVFLLDALRASDLGCYGEINPTSPHVDRMARRGVVFGANFAQAPNTPPSVKSILTGRYLPSIGHAKLPAETTTLAEAFAEKGYRTGAFSNSPYVAAGSGTDQGFHTLDPKLYIRGEAYAVVPPPKDYAGLLAAAFRTWLDEPGAADAPFFAYFHAVHPHNPYTPLPPWDRLLTEPGLHPHYDGTTQALLSIERGRLPADPDKVGNYLRLLYQEDVAYADWAAGLIQADLARRGRLEGTLFAVVADHGEEFLEHGGVLHGYTAFDEMLQVPLVIAGGTKLPQGATVRGLTQTMDLAPTLLDLASIAPPTGMQGRTLLPLAGARDRPQPEVFASASSAGGIYSLRSERTKYVFAPRKSGMLGGRLQGVGSSIGRKTELRYLYDLEADPREQESLMESTPILADFLHVRLMSWLQAVDESAAPSEAGQQPPDCNEELCLQLAQLGYIEAATCCQCSRYRDIWHQAADGTLAGRDRKCFEDQMEHCPKCREEYEAWKATVAPR